MCEGGQGRSLTVSVVGVRGERVAEEERASEGLGRGNLNGLDI